MADSSADLTALLHRWRGGSTAAENELFERVYGDLRRLAQHLLNRERHRATLQATELVDQLYLRLVSAKDRDWQNRQHFFALAARSMRRYLVDRARCKGHADPVALNELEAILPATSAKLDQVLLLDRLLHRMADGNPQWCTLVELKFFVGLSDEETAEAMGLKLRSMQRMWCDARHWLYERAGESDAVASAGSNP
jgi:RNA polymerase sigma-70 factor, ECF subfamily